MGAHFLELAGYATAAINDLVITGANEWTFGANGDYDSAVLRTSDNRVLIVRRPNSAAAAGEQLAISQALACLTQGLRSRLSFSIPAEVGRMNSAQVQIAVYDFIPGTTCDRVPLEHDSMLVADICVQRFNPTVEEVAEQCGAERFLRHGPATLASNRNWVFEEVVQKRGTEPLG